MHDSSAWKLQPQHRITDEQYRRILKEAGKRSRRDWMLVFLSGNTGLRISELLHLKVSDFDPASGIRVIRRKKKVLASEILEVSDDIFEIVASYVKEYGLKRDDWIFRGHGRPCVRVLKRRGKRTSETLCAGGHLIVRRAQAIWDRVLRATGLKMRGRGIHAMRHFNATSFYARTKDLRATQVRLGHTSPTITQIYADVVDGREQANRVGLLGVPPRSPKKK